MREGKLSLSRSERPRAARLHASKKVFDVSVERPRSQVEGLVAGFGLVSDRRPKKALPIQEPTKVGLSRLAAVLQRSTSKRTIQHTLSRLQCRYYNVEGS